MDMLLRRQIKKATNFSKVNYLSDMHKLKKKYIVIFSMGLNTVYVTCTKLFVLLTLV